MLSSIALIDNVDMKFARCGQRGGLSSVLEQIKNEPSLLMLSGGIGSAIMLACLKNTRIKLHTIFFDYRDGKNNERPNVEKLANYYGVHLTVADLGKVYDSMPVRYPIRFEKFNDYYIPFLNGVMVSVAAARAYFLDSRNVIWGLTSNSAAYYSDCSIHFVQSQSKAIYYGTNSCVKLITPFLEISKFELMRKAKKSGIHIPLELTRSCFSNGEEPCGKCFGCIERENNLKLMENADLEEYDQNREFGFDYI